jgi:hypothetical protein
VRVDPTASVAQNDSRMTTDPSWTQSDWADWMRSRVNVWSTWTLPSIGQFRASLTLPPWMGWTALGLAVLLIAFAVGRWRVRTARTRPLLPVYRALHRWEARWARAGHPRPKHEGWLAYGERLQMQQAELPLEEQARLLRLLARVLYGAPGQWSDGEREHLIRGFAQWRPLRR